MNFKEGEFEDADWILVAEDVDQWQAVMNVVVKFQIP